jgi:ubiquinone/menaquinone biosynthesis C-methylase UbiE
MGIYQKYILPKLVHYTCSLKKLKKMREKIVPMARGKVLEVGIGSGLNLPYYSAEHIQQVWGLDPSPEIWARAKNKVETVNFDVEFIEAGAENIPLDDGTVDTVLATYTLCTIPQILPALGEIHRVLGQHGKLLFCEHGTAPEKSTQVWQDRLNPIWKRFSGGCNLNRPIPSLLEQSGFKILEMESAYLLKWKPAGFYYWGTAQRAD